jgi:ribosomal protein S12 methylthiotransferase
MARRFWVETLGCPKNQVDSDKLTGTLLADGLVPANAPEGADLVVVNTCAFIEEARQESIDTVLGLAEQAGDRAELVVTGCLAERYGDELATALPEVEAVVGFGVPVHLGPRRSGLADPDPPQVPSFDLLNLPRPAPSAPWAYVKVAEGCDRACGFCAIPSFRGPQRSRSVTAIRTEVESLAAAGVREVVLVAQDLAAYGRDQGRGERQIVPLVEAVAEQVERVRLLYLYPSDLAEGLIAAICATGVPYFDLSLQHVARPLLRRMRRWGDGERFLQRIEAIRDRAPEATFRSSFIVGYPGETEQHHDQLLAFLRAAQLDWVGFFAYSREDGTYAADLDGGVDPALVDERLAELRDLQDPITAACRDALIGSVVEVLVDSPGIARGHREAPEIDGVITVPTGLEVGSLSKVRVVGASGPDLHAEPV